MQADPGTEVSFFNITVKPGQAYPQDSINEFIT